MANQNSFDIVSQIDFQEVDNAVNQALKEIKQRYDLKGTYSEILLNKKDKKINIESKDDFHLRTVLDILQNKMIKRGISLKALAPGELEQSPSGNVKQEIVIQQGIDKDNGRLIVKIIKDSKLKVQAAIQDEQVRVTGKSKDDLQEVMRILKEADLKFAVQFTNYR